MALEAIATYVLGNLGGFTIRKLGQRTLKFINSLRGSTSDRIDRRINQRIDRKINEKMMKIFGEIEPKYPRVNITGQPWIGVDNYYKASKSDNVRVGILLEADQRTGVIKLPLADIKGDYSKMLSAEAGVIKINVPQSSEVDLDSGENFLASSVAKMQISLPAPVEIWTDSVEYGGGILVVPIRASSPIKTSAIRQLYVPPPQVIPREANAVKLPVGRKTRTAIPILV